MIIVLGNTEEVLPPLVHNIIDLEINKIEKIEFYLT